MAAIVTAMNDHMEFAAVQQWGARAILTVTFGSDEPSLNRKREATVTPSTTPARVPTSAPTQARSLIPCPYPHLSTPLHHTLTPHILPQILAHTLPNTLPPTRTSVPEPPAHSPTPASAHPFDLAPPPTPPPQPSHPQPTCLVHSDAASPHPNLATIASAGSVCGCRAGYCPSHGGTSRSAWCAALGLPRSPHVTDDELQPLNILSSSRRAPASVQLWGCHARNT